MKKIFLFALCTIFLSFFAVEQSVAMSRNKKNETQITPKFSATGYVRVYGNEPHTWLGIVTEAEKEYALSADDETISSLRNLQGVLLTVKGTLEKSESGTVEQLRDGKIFVESFQKYN